MLKWILALFAVTAMARAADLPDGADLIHKLAARDKVLVAHRRAFDYDVTITREKLDENNAVTSTETETLTMRGDVSPSYKTRPDDPESAARQQSREEPFELLKIVDHYTYTVEGAETVDGVDCWRVHFVPKPDMPYDNREERVLNNTAGYIWVAKADDTLMRNEGALQRPVSVAWIFATLREMHFHFDATRLPNGEYGPGRLQYSYLVSIPFFDLHERDTRAMSNYRPHQ